MLAAFYIYLERLLELRRAQIEHQDFLKGVFNVLDAGNDDEALAICEDLPSPVANVTAVAIRQRKATARVLRNAVDSQGRAEIGRLDRRLGSLAIIGQVAPLLGLLGTVYGFIRTLLVLDAQPVVSRADLTEGAMQALVCAAMGLLVAIPVTVMYGSLRQRLDRIVVELEAAASSVLGYIATREHAK